MSVTAVAREMGFSPSFVSTLLSDPDGRRTRKAKHDWYANQRGTCPRCGGEISPRAETCEVCQPRRLAVRDSPIVDGCFDRRPPAKRCSGCGVVKDKDDYNTHKMPVSGTDTKALYLKAKCRNCQADDNKAVIFRRALKKGRVPRYVFLREWEASERSFNARGHKERIERYRGMETANFTIGGLTYLQTIMGQANVSERVIRRALIGYGITKRANRSYRSPVLTVDLGLLEVVLRVRELDLRDLPEWDWVIEDGPNRTYIGYESETGHFRERMLLPPSRAHDTRFKPASHP